MGDLREAFDRSVDGSQCLTGLDDALVEAGRVIADRVDDAIEMGEGQEVTKALYLLPHLNNVLREMYATPKSRLDAGLGKEDVGGKLASVRLLRSRPAPTKKRAEG